MPAKCLGVLKPCGRKGSAAEELSKLALPSGTPWL